MLELILRSGADYSSYRGKREVSVFSFFLKESFNYVTHYIWPLQINLHQTFPVKGV